LLVNGLSLKILNKMMQNDFTNPKQKEILAQFYSNVALAILTFGAIVPLFTGIRNNYFFSVSLIVSLVFTIIFLKVSLTFLK